MTKWHTAFVVVVTLGLNACAGTGNSSVTGHDEGMETRRVAALREVGGGDASDRICKSTPITGSRAMKRVCHTRAEWAAMRRNAEDTVRTTQQRPTGHIPEGSAGDYGN